MSGDVQVRKRKDKKRKRDSIDPKSEGDVLSRKLSVEEDEDPKEHHGVHATKMGTDDVHLHVQGDHETGGHWCAKIFFFSLLAILLGLIGLIIMENRGLSDLDTPLSESRFSEYFEGWVDEHRDAHDDHVDQVVADHDGAFDEEEEEQTELDDDHELESEPDEDHEEEEEDTDQQDEGVGADDDSEEEEEANLEKENDAGDADEDEEEPYHSRSKRSVPEDDEDEEDEEANEEEQQNVEDDNEEEEEEQDAEKKSDDDDEADEGFGEGNNEEDDQPGDEEETEKNNPQKPSYHGDPFDEEDNFDDDDEEPSIDVIENDDGETLHLQQKKAQEEPEQGGSSQEGFSSSLAVKIAVGVALAFVARLVLIRQNRSENTSSVKLEPEPEVPMREAPKSHFPPAPPKYEEHFDIDEELEEEYEEEDDQHNIHDISHEEDKPTRTYDYEPPTFEQFNAMYRPKGLDNLSSEDVPKQTQPKRDIAPRLTPQIIPKVTSQHKEEYKPTPTDMTKTDADMKNTASIEPPSVQKSEAPLLTATQVAKTSFSPQQELPAKEPVAKITPFMAHDRPNLSTATREQKPQETMGGIGLRRLHNEGRMGLNKPLPDDLLDDEEYEEELEDEEIEDEEISDVDDDDLMKRLDAKYGKLPQKTYESGDDDDDAGNVGSGEEDDVEDQSWTKVKSRGPQSAHDEDAFFEEELRRANEEMLQNQYDFQ